MHVRIVLVSALLLAGALAGCATNNAPTPTPTGGSPTPTASASPTPTASPTALPTPTISPIPGFTRITVGTEAAYPPFEDTLANGDIVGFDIDVMREVANRTALQVTFQNAGFTAIIPSIQSGQFDAGISAFTITDERKEQVDFTVSYYDNELLVAVRSDDSGIKTPADLKAHKICTQTGTTSESYLRENGQTNESLLLFDAFPPCADAVRLGDADAMIIDRAVVRTLISNSNGALKQAFTVPVDEHFGIAVSKDKKALLAGFNAALVAMKNDGTLQRLVDKWQV